MAAEGALHIPAESRFKAFVSYSHADKVTAQRLHRKLEAYRLPKHLRSEGVEAEHRNGRIGAIFRDREDLPAAQDLSESVKAALSASEALIVLCSPDARKSKWVAREIELFREIHPDRPILAAILRGEPEDAFPPPLHDGYEPLAADLRKEGDGARLGFLKIVAGLADVPLDALINRDAQRRVKRVTAVTVAAIAAMVVMALMTTFALQARNEAQSARADADGVVAYLLTDLRGKLKAVGRLDVMDDVNQRALKYYDDQGDLSALPDGSLALRAQFLQAMGEDDDRRGELDQALERFRKAHRVTEKLLALAPDNPDRIMGHAKSKYWVAYAQQQTSNAEAAKTEYTASLELLGTLDEKAAIGLEVQRQKGLIHNALGVINFSNLDHADTALGHFEDYRQVFEAITKRPEHSPDDQFRLADAYSWIAQVDTSQGKPDKALAGRNRQIAILDTILSDDPENDYMIWSRIGAERAIFRVCYGEDRLECAQGAIASARTILTSRDFDRTNREWLWLSAYVALDEGFLHTKLGNLQQARSALVEGREHASKYITKSPDNVRAVEDLNATIKALEKRT